MVAKRAGGARNMTRDDLRKMVSERGSMCVSNDIFEDLFFDPIEDDKGKERAHQFAKENNWLLIHQKNKKQVCFARMSENAGNEGALKQRRSFISFSCVS
jgi:hypothetical protein